MYSFLSGILKQFHQGLPFEMLFLKEFVSDHIPWAHFDIYGWNPAKRPGRAVGGEAMGLRAAYAMLASKYEA